MNFTDYFKTFDAVLSGENTNAPYNDEHFVEYVKLNHSRVNRWIKKGILSEETIRSIQGIKEKQTWLVITEPWCGDASHNVPFIVKMAELNPLITLEIQLRDSAESEIESYLTNGGKSIPKLIIRNELGKDLIIWGPRPAEAQALFHKLKGENLTLEEQKVGLQQWYNQDQGQTIQIEIVNELQRIKID
jgi:hypothetical protein